MSYTQHISAEQRSAVARANGSRGGTNKFVWTARRKRRAHNLLDGDFSYRDIAKKMRCEVGSVAGMFFREKKRRQ